MEIIDAHLHGWELPNLRFPWDSKIDNPAYNGHEPITAERLVGMMDAIGVAGSLLTSPSNYGQDHSYAFDAAERFPGRFGVVGPIKHPDAPEVEDLVRGYSTRANAVAVRVSFSDEQPPHWRASHRRNADSYRRVFQTAEAANVPVLFWVASTRLTEIPAIARAYPNMLMVIDHLGMIPIATPSAEKLARFGDLLALAPFDNVALKCTAVPSLSSEPYPYLDMWPYLHQAFDAFGLHRIMWGTDMTKHMKNHTYEQGLNYLRDSDELSESEKEILLGGTLRRLLRWSPSRLAAASADSSG